MKKLISAICVMALSMTMLTGCGTAEEVKEDAVNNKNISVVTTIFPEYDWVREIVNGNENIEITMLLDKGVDLHSFQPAASDIVKISTCDMFVYVGGESDEWVEDVLAEAVNKDMVVINLLDILGENVKEEEIVEGMEAEEEEGHSHEKKAVTEDRPLTNFEGEWQSVFPYMDDNFKSQTASYMAEAEGFDDLDEAWDFFYEGNKTDVRYINISGDQVEFINENGDTTVGTYEYDGWYSDCWGETSIRYQYINTDENSDAPKYIQFDDHLNYETPTEHFHIYCGDDGEEMLDIMYSWPTYYPSEITDDQEMIDEFLKHYIDEDEEEEEEEEVEYDEHVWLSLKNAEVICQYIADELCRIDSENKALYETNAATYIAELETLDKDYEEAVKNATENTILFGDRFPFRYMVDDYGLNYYAAFVGCSAESEASFETITFLANKMDELKLPVILQIESADGKIAETIKNATKDKNQQILTMDSMQSVTAKDVTDGATYLEIMKSNLDILKIALN